MVCLSIVIHLVNNKIKEFRPRFSQKSVICVTRIYQEKNHKQIMKNRKRNMKTINRKVEENNRTKIYRFVED